MSDDHQADALTKAYQLLSEHFPAFVIVTREDTPDEEQQQAKITFLGGYFNAIGMISRAQDALKEMLEQAADDEEENEK